MELIVKGEGARLFLHPGKGKTATVLKAFSILKAQGIVDKLLVIAPLRVITTSWPAQLDYWEDFEHLTYTIIHGDRTEAMGRDVDVYLMNLEGLLSPEWLTKKGNSLLSSNFALKFLSTGRFMLALDESTKMKNSSSTRFKVLKKYLHKFTHRTIMTGTPKPNKLEDLFSQCYITDQGIDLGSFVTHFRHQYMMPSEDGFGYVAQPGAAARVAKKIAPTTLQLDYEEAVPSQVIPIWVPMPDHIKPFYEELRREFIASIDNQLVMAPNSAALLNKLRQVAQGAIYKPVKEDGWLNLHDAKLDALENILEELGGDPAFCLFQFRHDVARINERLKMTVPTIASGTSAAQGAAYVAQFSNGDIPLLLGHPQSVAHGVDGLQKSCNNVIWFGLDWSWENYYQANLRIVRHGSKAEQVFIYQILVDCPTERAVLESVSGKQLSEAEFLSKLRGYLQ